MSASRFDMNRTGSSRRNGTSRATLASTVIVALALAMQNACIGDLCGNEQNECIDATTLRTCGGSVDAIGASRHWSTSSCEGLTPYCVTRPEKAHESSYNADNRSMCAASSEPSPLCAGRANNVFFCDGATMSKCAGGYLVAFETCAEGCFADAERECAVCIHPGYEPDPECVAGESGPEVCHGDAIYACECGYRTTRKQACDGPCVLLPPQPDYYPKATPACTDGTDAGTHR